MQLYIVAPKGGEVEDTLVSNLAQTFRELGIKEDGTSMQLREPSKKGGY
jgi:hypothetical protein